jgi:hypothetical protein
LCVSNLDIAINSTSTAAAAAAAAAAAILSQYTVRKEPLNALV